MSEEARAQRQARIEAAAFALLEERGYAGTSMLAIARRARASNETLYNWYGDKAGLFKALIARNSADLRAHLEADVEAGADPVATLRALGPKLLRLVLGPRAVALNRAAAADPSGQLGRALSAAGRETVLPRIAMVLERARASGAIEFETVDAALDLYVSLLIGDQQVRRVIGVLEVPEPAESDARAARALGHFLTLLRPQG
ncbi:MAG: TetR/AcrR family transcriptional regulator [Pseudomonadota bacterium]